MRYFFVQLGEHPQWLFDSIKSVQKNDSSSEIYFCGDSPISYSGVENIDLKNILSEETKIAFSSSVWKNDNNPLWRTSIYRIFILLDMMNGLGVNDFVHFDSDVILFHSFEDVKSSIGTNKKALHITPCNDDELVFGYSYCNSKEALTEVCDTLLKAMFNQSLLMSLTSGFPNEMQILRGIQKIKPDLIQSLKTIPTDNEEYVFDPSSYGQYLFGTHNGHQAGWHGDHHWIGKMIGENKLKVYIDDIPYANNSKIVNLHIHSKKTKGVV